MKKLFLQFVMLSSLLCCTTLSWAEYVTMAAVTPSLSSGGGSGGGTIKPVLPPLDASNLAILTFTPPAPWKIVGTTQKPGMRTTRFAKVERIKTRESLSEIKLDKETGRDAKAIVDGMSSNLKDLAVTDKCEVEEVKALPQTGDKFQVWMQTFQCKQSNSSIIQLYVNTDPKHLYLFTYTDPVYPFTDSDRSTAEQMLKSSIQICYKGQPCLPLS